MAGIGGALQEVGMAVAQSESGKKAIVGVGAATGGALTGGALLGVGTASGCGAIASAGATVLSASSSA
ncbi:MAG: hypothetical protein IJO46_13850, partial [Thermoguttaceae bacterium]|nr:hypothetical protein [Thermoguttaceae bacterium]